MQQVTFNGVRVSAHLAVSIASRDKSATSGKSRDRPDIPLAEICSPSRVKAHRGDFKGRRSDSKCHEKSHLEKELAKSRRQVSRQFACYYREAFVLLGDDGARFTGACLL